VTPIDTAIGGALKEARIALAEQDFAVVASAREIYEQEAEELLEAI